MSQSLCDLCSGSGIVYAWQKEHDTAVHYHSAFKCQCFIGKGRRENWPVFAFQRGYNVIKDRCDYMGLMSDWRRAAPDSERPVRREWLEGADTPEFKQVEAELAEKERKEWEQKDMRYQTINQDTREDEASGEDY